MDGKDLIALGIPQGPHIGVMLKSAQYIELYSAHLTADEVLEMQQDRVLAMWKDLAAKESARIARQLPLRDLRAPYGTFIDRGFGDYDINKNTTAVLDTMDDLMKVPVVTRGAVMPDACPAGTIPVGGVVVSEHIHPGFHSADICCSMFMSVFDHCEDRGYILDQFAENTHFGAGGRSDNRFSLPADMVADMQDNPFLADLIGIAEAHLGTQGDGNHFGYVGSLESTGQPTLVTHHGSRGLGAKLFKKGMQVAIKFGLDISPETPAGAAWIPSYSAEGAEYWNALQIVRRWTKLNHQLLHDAVGLRAHTRLWNEHNFVFRKNDGLFYHAKGATPTGFKWASDATPFSLIPMNMAEPILIVEAHPDAPEAAMGFAPHGAGRNYSRTEHIRRKTSDLGLAMGDDRGLSPNNVQAIINTEAPGIDVRFWCGIPDVSELPSAYKNAAKMVAEIEEHRLAQVVDRVLPFGSIMAGDWESDAPWRKKRKEKEKAI